MTAPQAGAATKMQQILNRAQAATQQLLELMQTEIERLGRRETEGLDALLGAKLEALQELEACEQARQELVAASGRDAASGSSMVAYLEALGDEAVALAWQELVRLLAQIQAQNEANGSVINRSLDQVQRELAIFRGHGPEATTYDPKGRADTPRSREISRA